MLLWEIGEAFMVEMAFDLNFAGCRVSHKWRRKVAKHVLCPTLLSPLSLLPLLFVCGGHTCALGVIVFEHDLVVFCICVHRWKSVSGVCLHADVYVCACLHASILYVGVVRSGCVPASKPI